MEAYAAGPPDRSGVPVGTIAACAATLDTMQDLPLALLATTISAYWSASA